MNEVIKRNGVEFNAERFRTLIKDCIEDCKDILTEAVFTSRWALVEGYWHLGQRIDEEVTPLPITILLQGLAVELKTSERTLWYAVQFHRKYPELDTVPEGKNISWNKLVTKYLPAPKEKEEHEHAWEVIEYEVCKICGKKQKRAKIE